MLFDAKSKRHVQPKKSARMTVLVTAMCALLLAGCSDEQPPTEYKTTAYVFGTLVDITIRGTDTQSAEAADADLSAGFQDLHNDWHAWKPLGELAAINGACKSGGTVTVGDKTLIALQKAKDFEISSHGLFNAALGRVIGLWGFHSDTLPKGEKPPFDQIDALVAQSPSMADIRITGHDVMCINPAVSLDFGGFGKGLALDWALDRLQSKGIANALINAGGDVSSMGHYAEADTGRPWRIGIRHPKTWGVLASVDVDHDEAVYTSGNYERYNEQDGIRYSHIIDPRNGRAVQSIVSSTVIHTDSALADAAATALSVAGLRDWPRIAADMGVSQVMVVDETGHMYATPDMRARLIFGSETKPEITVVPLPTASPKSAVAQ